MWLQNLLGLQIHQYFGCILSNSHQVGYVIMIEEVNRKFSHIPIQQIEQISWLEQRLMLGMDMRCIVRKHKWTLLVLTCSQGNGFPLLWLTVPVFGIEGLLYMSMLVTLVQLSRTFLRVKLLLSSNIFIVIKINDGWYLCWKLLENFPCHKDYIWLW